MKSPDILENRPLRNRTSSEEISSLYTVFWLRTHSVDRIDRLPVLLVVKKAGGATPHSIALKAPEAGIVFSVSLGKTPKTISFTPTKVGTYPFWCTKKLPFLKSHKDHGMTGVIEVVD